MSAQQLKVGDLVTFVYCTPEKASVQDFAPVTIYDPLQTVRIIRKAYARRILKVRGHEVLVNFEGRKRYLDSRSVNKVWC